MELLQSPSSAHDTITVTISPAEHLLLQKLQVIRGLITKQVKGKTISGQQSNYQPNENDKGCDVVCPASLLSSHLGEHSTRTASPASSRTSSTSSISSSVRSNSSHTSNNSALTRLLQSETTSSIYGFDDFCRDFNPEDPHIVRLLELLVEETAEHKSPAAGMQSFNVSKQHSNSQAATEDLVAYFCKSPVPTDFEFTKAQPSHRRMLEQAITNGYYSNTGTPSPSFGPELNSAISTPPPLDLQRTSSGVMSGEDEHWQRLYNRRMQRERGREEAPVYVQHTLFHPSSIDSLASSVMNPPSNLSSRESSRPRWIDTDGTMTISATNNTPSWDIRDDSSLDGLEIQSIEGICLSHSWE